MKPLDPRLLHYAKSARIFIIISVITGLLIAVFVIAQTILIALIVSPLIYHHKTFSQVLPLFIALICVIVTRSVVIWLKTLLANRAATHSISQLRNQVLRAAAAHNTRWLATHSDDVVTLVSRGLDNLGPYFTEYLPQLILCTTVTPLVLLVMVFTDFWSVLVALIALPLIPVFMILIGRFTQDFSSKRLATMQQLGRQLLDVIAGLMTLKSFGREEGPALHISRIGKKYTQTTMATLRIAFLSGAVLEFLSVMAVAMVAVESGFRLFYGNINLQTALIIIMLTPEVYQPLREVGKQFHASADGVSAAEAAFAIIEDKDSCCIEKITSEDPSTDSHHLIPAPSLKEATFIFDDVSVSSRTFWAPAHLSAQIHPGKITALVGHSGSGKTTASMLLLHHLLPTRGKISLSTTPDKKIYSYSQLFVPSLWEQAVWLPQQPCIIPTSVLRNILTSQNDDTRVNSSHEVLPENVKKAAALSGFQEVVDTLSEGYNTRIGQGGIGLSVGQRQRLALTAALVTPAQLIVMDEPTAHLDARLEDHVLNCLRELRSQGKTVVVIAHHPALIDVADDVIHINSEPMSEKEKEIYYQADDYGAQAQEAQLPQFLIDTSSNDDSLETGSYASSGAEHK